MKRLWEIALLMGALALGACQPVSNDSGGTVPAVPAVATAPTVLMLPDGNECSWSGEGATLAFDGQGVNYTCSGENVVLLGDPVPVDDIHWTVTEGTLAQGTNGFELSESHQLTFLLGELQLADGTSCLNAGMGATFAVNDQRVNWTCGERNAPLQAVVAGPVTAVGADSPGAYQAQKSQVEQTSNGFTASDTQAVSVARIIGSDGVVSTMPGQNGGGLPPGPAEPTTIVLPDGNTCLWAGEGATLAFDGERVNYTCSTENTVLLGDPVMDEDTVWTVTVGTLSGTELASSEEVTFQLNELDLVDDSVCLHAGRGATMAFDEGRLNWSCGEDKQGQYGVFGPLQHEEGDAPGAYYAIKILIGRNDSGFYPQTTFRVPVTTIIGSEVALTPGEQAMAAGTPTTIILPDGNTCLWAGEGATLAFDGERVNYTCSTENTVLIGDPVQDEETVWTVTVGTLNGTELASSIEVRFQLNELDLANGASCLHAGRGATFGIEGERVNWTCGANYEAAAAGPLTTSADTPGVYSVIYATVVMSDGVPPQGENPESVAVDTIVGSEVSMTPGEIAMATQAAYTSYTSPAGFSITIPASWIANNYTVEELAGDDATALNPLAQNVTRFVYTPADSSYAPFAVLTIYTFTSDDWATVDTESGPPVGSEVATGDGVVYVASTPQSNPYPEGTDDAANFNAMAADIGAAVASIQ